MIPLPLVDLYFLSLYWTVTYILCIGRNALYHTLSVSWISSRHTAYSKATTTHIRTEHSLEALDKMRRMPSHTCHIAMRSGGFEIAVRCIDASHAQHGAMGSATPHSWPNTNRE